jgi:hypothetical protein
MNPAQYIRQARRLGALVKITVEVTIESKVLRVIRHSFHVSLKPRGVLQLLRRNSLGNKPGAHRLEHVTQHPHLANLCDVKRPHCTPAARVEGQDALGVEIPHGLSHWSRAHVQHRRNVRLNDSRPGLKSARQDGVAKPVTNAFVQRSGDTRVQDASYNYHLAPVSRVYYLQTRDCPSACLRFLH